MCIGQAGSIASSVQNVHARAPSPEELAPTVTPLRSVPTVVEINRAEAQNDRAILAAMPFVLLTGSERRIAAASRSLADAGCHCLTATSPGTVAAALRPLGDERLAAYVQLPVEVSDAATTAVGRIRELLTEGLVARCAAAEMAAASVGDGGVIVLVVGTALLSVRYRTTAAPDTRCSGSCHA